MGLPRWWLARGQSWDRAICSFSSARDPQPRSSICKSWRRWERTRERSLRFVQGGRTDGRQSSAGPGALLFAVPVVISSSEPAVGSHVSACSESSADDASRSQAGSQSSSPAATESPGSSPCARSKPADVKVPKKHIRQVGNEVALTPPAAPTENQPQNSGNRPSSDKRSCRVLVP